MTQCIKVKMGFQCMTDCMSKVQDTSLVSFSLIICYNICLEFSTTSNHFCKQGGITKIKQIIQMIRNHIKKFPVQDGAVFYYFAQGRCHFPLWEGTY